MMPISFRVPPQPLRAQPSRIRLRLAVPCLALLLAGCPAGPPEHRPVTAEGGEVRLALSVVGDGGVHFFTYRHGGKNVNFLVRTDGGGRLHAHLDACYSCYRYRRGFVVEGRALLCIACRLTYPIEDEEWDFIGACAPIPVAFTVERGEVVIRSAVLERAARFF